jgi:hypothetical protein|tara:strand:+ start:2468 stop:2569 length:102 start_codon:yes stop_codon:yes gene_type:complete
MKGLEVSKIILENEENIQLLLENKSWQEMPFHR